MRRGRTQKPIRLLEKIVSKQAAPEQEGAGRPRGRTHVDGVEVKGVLPLMLLAVQRVCRPTLAVWQEQAVWRDHHVGRLRPPLLCSGRGRREEMVPLYVHAVSFDSPSVRESEVDETKSRKGTMYALRAEYHEQPLHSRQRAFPPRPR
jgi:hypothetical protein